MKKSLLYTRTGDAGTTSLIGGQRIAKNSPRVSAYGSVDELNAMIGLVQAHCTDLDDFVTSTLLTINNTLFNIGAYLATPSETVSPLTSAASSAASTGSSVASDSTTAPNRTSDSLTDSQKSPSDAPTESQEDVPEVSSPISPDLLTALEHQIDLLDSTVPPLRQFILPGGSVGAAHAHVARTVCRRAERDILTLADTGAYVHPAVLTYINRLSDYLFILARYINHFTGTPELTWKQ